MICPKCRTENDDTFQFCSECGVNFSAAAPNNLAANTSASNSDPRTLALPVSALNLENSAKTNKDIPATQYSIPAEQVRHDNSGTAYQSDEFQTVVKPPNSYQNDSANFNQPTSGRSLKIPLILLGFLTIVLLGVIGYLVIPPLLKKTVIPDHFGLFNKKDEQLSELRLREFGNLLKGRDELTNDASLPVTEANPNLILYSDGQTIPVVDMKLIKLDSIKDDGKIENWEYQIAPVEGNARLKQIKVNAGLPKGKYALALFKGNFDEGTHKLWAFQVEKGAESPARSQVIALALKPTPTPTPQIVTKMVTPTPDEADDDDEFADDEAETGTCIENNVVMRSSPTISESNKIDRLDRGQKVVIIKYSAGTETWNGVTAKWLYVKKSNGKTGWVFGAFIK